MAVRASASHGAVRAARTVVVVALALAPALTSGCSGGGSDQDDAAPSPRPGRPAAVDVCRLVPLADVSELVGHQVSVVDGQYLSASLPTYRCGFGIAFGHAQVSLTLTPGPVAPAVFDEAYGEPVGGDPIPIEELGDGAYLRNEEGVRSLAVLSHGAILQVAASRTAADGIRPRELVALTRLAVQQLPSNPVLGVPRAGSPCTQLPARVVESALGAPVERAGALARGDGSAVCSWAGLPGAVTVVVQHGAADVAAAERQQRRDEGVPVDGLGYARGWSASDRPGDLVLVPGPTTSVRIEVIPAAGWASDDVPTTRPETALARAVVRQLA